MMTLMPVAAFADPIAADTSAFACIDGDKTIRVAGSAKGETQAVFMFSGNEADTDPAPAGTTMSFYVWAVDANGAVSSALALYEASETTDGHFH